MPLEQGMRQGIFNGFIIIIALCFIPILILWIKTKNKGLGWFIAQFIFLYGCLGYFLKIVDNPIKVSNSMITEANTMTVTFMIVAWTLSMVCMIIGIFSIINKTQETSKNYDSNLLK